MVFMVLITALNGTLVSGESGVGEYPPLRTDIQNKTARLLRAGLFLD